MVQCANRRGLSVVAVILAGFILAFFSLVVILAVRGIAHRWSPSIDNAERLLARGKYDEALTLARRVETSGEREVERLVLLGKLRLAKAWEQQHRENWRNYGKDENDWMPTEHASRAESRFKQALELQPDYRDAHYYLGILYMEKGWFSAAESEFLSILRSHPDQAPARINLGVLYTRMDRYREAEEELRSVWRSDDENVAAARNLAFLYRYYLEIPESAMVWSNRYLNLEPERSSGPTASLDRSFVKRDLQRMLKRYPEFALDEKRQWEKQPRFKPREY